MDWNKVARTFHILSYCAGERRTITYRELSNKLGHRPAIKGTGGTPQLLAARTALSKVAHWCRHNGYPPITLLVVSENGGLPGKNAVERDVAYYKCQARNYAVTRVMRLNDVERKNWHDTALTEIYLFDWGNVWMDPEKIKGIVAGSEALFAGKII